MVLLTIRCSPGLYGLIVLYLSITSEAFSPHLTATIRAHVPAKERHQAGTQVDAVDKYRMSTLKAKQDDDDDGKFGDADSSNSVKNTMGLPEKMKKKADLEAARREMENAKKKRGNETLRRCKLEYTDADTMILDIPPCGIDRMDIMRGAISLAMSSPLLFWGILHKPMPMLMASPVLVIAGSLVKEAIYEPFTSSRLTIGEFAWSMEERFLGQCIRKEEGITKELSGATVNPWVWDIRMPNEDEVFRMALVTKLNDAVDFGLSRSVNEFGYLASEIDNHLKYMEIKVKVQEYSEALQETPGFLN